jgi:hypothetical protein
VTRQDQPRSSRARPIRIRLADAEPAAELPESAS